MHIHFTGLRLFIVITCINFMIENIRTTKVCQRNCVCNDDHSQMICEGHIPTNTPVNITHVEITSILTSFNGANFSGSGWKDVQHLVIMDKEGVSQHNYWLVEGTFSNLPSLTYLKLRLHTVSRILPEAFEGLFSLKYLILSQFSRLPMEDVLAAFNNSLAFPHLTSLDIYCLNTFKFDPQTVLDDQAFRTLALRNISELKLHMFIKQLTIPIYDGLIPTIKKVDFSSSYIEKGRLYILQLAKSIWYLNLSKIQTKWGFEGAQGSDTVLNLKQASMAFRAIRHLRMLILDDIITLTPTLLTNVTVIFPELEMSLEKLSVKQNLLQKLDISPIISHSLFKNLRAIDAQDNMLEYINPMVFLAFSSLRYLNISNNTLGKMQNRNFSIFNNITYYIKNLDTLDMSDNGLRNMHSDMTKGNEHLKKLYLRNNKLTQFAQTQILNITFLDLSYNSIKYLDSNSIKWLEDVNRVNANNLHVNLFGNPLLCSCKEITFITWFVSSRMFHAYRYDYKCRSNGHTHILTRKFVKDQIYDCESGKRLRANLFSSVIPSIIVIVAACVSLYFFRLRKRKRKQEMSFEENRRKLRKGTHELTYPVFLSFSSPDGDFVFQEIYPALLQGIQAAVGAHANFVCVGELHFRPGYSVHEEIIRCLKVCGVFMAVITKDYCYRPYCQNEFEQAYAMRKPILQMYVDEIDKDEMWPFLRQTFERYTRIKLVRNGDRNGIAFQPDIGIICKSILELM